MILNIIIIANTYTVFIWARYCCNHFIWVNHLIPLTLIHLTYLCDMAAVMILMLRLGKLRLSYFLK